MHVFYGQIVTSLQCFYYEMTVRIILIKITQCQYLVRTFLQNGSTDFDEILHVVWEWLPEGYGTSGRSGYSPV